MKDLRLFILSLFAVFFIACNDDGPGTIVPDLQIKDNISQLEFSSADSLKRVDVLTNVPELLTVTVPESDQVWCVAKIQGSTLLVSVEKNIALEKRETNVLISAGDKSVTLKVVQFGLEMPEIINDTKLQVVNATASSEEIVNEKTCIENSYDGDFNTFWHTKWTDQGPYTATYFLKDADKLDYIMYYPRTPNGGNGNFGKVDIYVTTVDNPEFVKVLSYDHGNSGNSAKITLPSPVLKPTAVKFEILSGSNGNASCSEMEFYSAREGSMVTREIPLGGNSYVTTGTGTIADVGFTNWNSTSTVYSTYFRVNQPGALYLYLKYTPNGDGNVIDVTALGKTFTVTLPKGNGMLNTVPVGVLNVTEAGYVKVDFQGKTMVGTTFGIPMVLAVAGDASKDMNYVGDFSYYWGRRGPSVHMRYAIPNFQTYEWFYSEVTVPEGYDPSGSYFMANGFGQGYFGMQVNSETERRVLFSVWSSYETDDPALIPQEDRVVMVRKGEDVTVNDFGNEGSGGQSYWKYMWKTGTTYKFLNRVRPVENGYTEYTGYFYAPEIGKWKLISQWLRPKTQTYYTDAHSFLENFNNNMGALTRKANYANQWIYTTSGQWVELTNGFFTMDETGSKGWRKDFLGGVENSSFFLQNCGFFNQNVPYGSTFSRSASGVAPNIDWSTLE